jgi:glycosyltransferase involved in cell wall biosynthesis
MVTNPVFNTLFLPKVLKRKRIDTTLLVHDIFPENTLEAGIFSSNLIYQFIKKLFDSSYSSVSRCVVLGRDMSEVIKKKTNNVIPIQIIENWADVERILPKIKKDNLNKIVLKFSGNIGRVQGLEKLFCIIKQVVNKNLLFVFAGKGALLNKLKQLKDELKLDNVLFEDAYSKENEINVLNNCDISLISLGASMYGLGVPSKSYNCMAVGKPLLYIGPENSEIYFEVIENKIGWAFSPDDKELINFLNKLEASNPDFVLFSSNARKCAEEKYSKEIILNKYKNLFIGVSK